MRFGGRRTSTNVSSQRGQRFGGGGRGGGLGRNMLFAFIFRRFGIWGVLALLAFGFFFGDPVGLMDTGGQQSIAPHQRQARPSGGGADVCQSDQVTRFSCQVLASTEDRWSEMFREAGARYQPPQMVVYDRRGQSGCGAAQSAMGPFYCPADQGIYLDTDFFRELAERHGAPGRFAQAYVIAHEVGHHVQTITGTSRAIRQAQAAAGGTQANALQVRMELQADCYAGVWAARERGEMEPDSLEQGMRAAAAIGDDTLQRAARGRVAPESFTHGSAAQRQEALLRGFRGGSPDACAGYMEGVL